MAVQYEPGFWGNVGAGLQRGVDLWLNRRLQAEAMAREDRLRQEAIARDDMLRREANQRADEQFNANALIALAGQGQAPNAALQSMFQGRGVNVGELAPNRADIRLSPRGKPTGFPDVVIPSILGGAPIPLPAFKSWTPDELEGAGVKTPEQRRLSNATTAAQTRTAERVAGATDAQVDAAAGLKPVPILNAETRKATSDIVDSDIDGLAWKWYQKNATLQGPEKMSMEAMANAAYNDFANARRRDGYVSEADLPAYASRFNEALGAIKMRTDEFALREREIATRIQALREQGDNPQVLVNLLQSMKDQANSIRQFVPQTALMAPDSPLAAPYKQYIQRFNQIQCAITNLQPVIATKLNLPPEAVQMLSGIGGAEPQIQLSPLDQRRVEALRKLGEGASEALQRGLKEGTITQQQYDLYSRVLGINTPLQGGK